MTAILVLTLAIAVLYLAVSLYLSSGLLRLKTTATALPELPLGVSVSVIVAARNEEHTLPNLLNSLKMQTYPQSLFDITIVDDRSSDGTASVVQEFQQSMTNLHLIRVDQISPGIAPKKNAVTVGIGGSSGEIIALTDADCVVPSRWIEEIVRRFSDSRVGLVQGLTTYPHSVGDSLFQRFQRLDFFSHSVVAAAGIGRGLPINSNANNFSYRRQLFEQLKGFEGCEHIVSGDDDLLLQKVWESGVCKIEYLNTPDAAVETVPEKTLRGFFEQRKRWGSKTVFYKPKQVIVLALIFCFYLTVALTTVAGVFNPKLWLLIVALYLVKILGELLFLLPGTRLFRALDLRRDIFWASPLQLWLVLYSVFAGVLGGFSWKGTSYRKSVKKS